MTTSDLRPDARIIPNAEPDPREASRRNRAALRYLHQCGFLRMEPNKHNIEAILLGRDTEEIDHE